MIHHPVWLVGFRPFFAVACITGAVFPLLWVAQLLGASIPLNPPVAPAIWHAHEMFFGFGWAVLGGFLLTATKNWVHIRGYHGLALVLLLTAWCAERLLLAFGGGLPEIVWRPGSHLFITSIVALLLWTLIRHRDRDSFSDNYFFLIALPAFLIAKYLLLSPPHAAEGIAMTIALFRVAFLVMLERTLSGFMRSAFQIDLARIGALDLTIKGCAVVCVTSPWLPQPLVAGMETLLALLLTVRFFLWQPRLGLTRIDIGIMYLGYLAIVLQLLASAWQHIAPPFWVGSMAVHLFSFGPMGLIIPAMIVRISKGHTGRPVIFSRYDKTILWIMLTAFVIRVLMPQLMPDFYRIWVTLAGLNWSLAFALLGWRYIPYVLQARVDGRPH